MKRGFLPVFLCISLAIFPFWKSPEDKGAMTAKNIIKKISHIYKELRKETPFVNVNGQPVAQSIRFIQPSDIVTNDYGKIRQIALVRHGEPDMEKNGKFTREQAKDFLKCYDSVCIIVPDKPFFELQNKEEAMIFSSPINRALSTARYLCGEEQDITISPVFREFENKICGEGNSGKSRSIKRWKTVSRIKWMLGIGDHSDIESYSAAKKRAKQAAGMLENASRQNPKILVTAHGMLNWHVRKNLEKMGWKVVEDTGNDYFGTSILVKVE